MSFVSYPSESETWKFRVSRNENECINLYIYKLEMWSKNIFKTVLSCSKNLDINIYIMKCNSHIIVKKNKSK